MSDRDELLERERAFWDAAGDGQFYADHFSADGVCVFGMGVLDRRATIDAIAAADPWLHVAFDDATVVPIARGVAALVYAATASRAGDDAPYRVRVSSVYVRRDHDWWLTLHQQTPVD